jgi:hypothetical protein
MEAVRLATPPSVGFLVQLIKNTSLAAVIGFVGAGTAADALAFTRSMREITAPWQRTQDTIQTVPAAPSAAAWTPTRAVDLPTSDLAGNAAVRSVTRVSAMEVSRPLPSLEMPRIPTVQDPLARRALDAGTSPRQPVAPPPAFRRDEFRISPGMGDGFPMGNFR